MTGIEEAARRRAEAAAGRSEERQVTLTRSDRDELAEAVKQMMRESRRVLGTAIARVVERWDGPDAMRSAKEWAWLDGVQIRGADGWGENALQAGDPEKGLGEPISRLEYERRLKLSTIGPA